MGIKTYADAKSDYEASIGETLTDEQLKSFNAMYDEERRSVLSEEVAKQEALTQGSRLSAIAGSVGAGTLGAIDTTTFGRLPQALSAAGLESSAGKLDLAFDVAQETNPYASGLGRFGGYFVGPAGAASKLAGRVAGTATGTKALAARSAEKHLAVRAAAHTMQNLASGAGALTAERLLEHRDDGADLQQRLAEAGGAVTSPLFLTMAAGGGGLSAKFTHRPPAEARRLFNKYERLTGEKVPVEVYTDSKSMQDAFEALRHVPGISNDAVKVVRTQQKALLRMVDEMVRDHALPHRGQTERTTRRAAAAVRRLSGVGDEAGLVTKIRRGKQAAAMQEHGGVEIGPEATKSLRGAMAKIISQRTRRTERVGKRGRGTGTPGDGTSTQAYIDRIRRLTRASAKGKPLNIAEMESLRRGLSVIAKWDKRTAADASAHSDEAVREARMLYDMLGSAIKRSSKTYHEVAIESARGLHARENVLKRIKIDKLDDAVIQDFLTGEGVVQRIESLQKYGKEGDFEQVLGWMVGKMIRESWNEKTGVISAAKLKQKLFTGGPMNREVFDRFLPGLRRELVDSASISEEMVKGLMKAEGSVTSRKGPLIAGATASGPAGIIFLNNLLANPMGTTGTVLGAAGIQLMVARALKSGVIESGAINQTLQGLARGAPKGLSRLPVAVSNTAEDRLQPTPRWMQELRGQ